jgi:GAF domain-containing protein
VLALRPDLADSLVLVARELNAPRDLTTTLHRIVEVAARSLPGIDHVGITLGHSPGQMETKAATDEFAWKLDRLQQEVGEGPLVHAIEGRELVLVEDAEDDSRWPQYIKPAIALGLRSQLGIRLCADEQTLGGLNLYSSSTDTVDPDVVHLAELFAEHAALALGRAQREDQLQVAITTRQLIGQATGIMERHALDEVRAFDHLIRVSSHRNVKLRDVARELVDEANGQADPRAEALSHGG